MRALDLAGHGASPPLGRPVGLDLLVQGVVEQVGEPFDVVAGHSLGAVVALAVADRRPRLARALVLEDPPASGVAHDRAFVEGIAGDATLVRTNREQLVRREREANSTWLDEDVQRSVDSALANPDRTQLLRMLPADRVVVVQGKHCLHRDQPERWVEEVHAFALQPLGG